MAKRRVPVMALTLVLCLVAGACSHVPSRSGLVTKLEKRNGLTASQARCVADGLYDGKSDAKPATRALTKSELQAVAKPDNAGKVSPEVVQILRDVVGACVPTTSTTVPAS